MIQMQISDSRHLWRKDHKNISKFCTSIETDLTFQFSYACAFCTPNAIAQLIHLPVRVTKTQNSLSKGILIF